MNTQSPQTKTHTGNLSNLDLNKLLPWRWKMVYWASTLVMLIPLVLYGLVAVANPLWFRDSMLRSALSFVDLMHRMRCTLIRPAVEKYSLLESIRQGKKII
jgi:hypothetical protein